MPAMKKLSIYLVFMILFTAAACSPAPAGNIPGVLAVTKTPFAPMAAAQTAQVLFSQPENIVQAFLTDVQEAPAQVNSYLSQAMQKKYPGSQVIELLGLPGDINGFAIKSVEANFKNPLAVVTVGLDSQSQIIIFKFTLVVEHSQWVIDGIERVQNSG